MKQDWAWRRPGDEPETSEKPEQAAPEEAANQRAAGTGEVSQGHDIKVAGGPVQEPRSEPAQPAEPNEPAEPALAKEEVATEFPKPEEPAEPEPAEAKSAEPETAEQPRHAKPADEVLEHFMDSKAAEGFRERWHEVQIGFVDDPRGSVGQAEELAAEVLNALSRTLNERKSALDAEWRTEGDGPDTEQLRLAIRGYREFFNRILDL